MFNRNMTILNRKITYRTIKDTSSFMVGIFPCLLLVLGVSKFEAKKEIQFFSASARFDVSFYASWPWPSIGFRCP